ncbi:MAG: sensor histidine kinase, partial [bacterium]
VLQLGGSALGIAASVALLRSRAPIQRLLNLSVTLDAAMVFLGFLPLVLWPWPYYPGIVNTPDIAALLIVTLAAGLRLSPRVAVYGAILNVACFVTLLLLDVLVSRLPAPDQRLYQYLLVGTYLITVVIFSIVIAVRTQRLVERAVRAALKADRAQHSFGAILHEHHDVRTLLSAVRLNADRLASNTQVAAQDLVAELCIELDDVETLLNTIRARAYGELLTFGPSYVVEVCAIAHEVLDRLRLRFPDTALMLSGETWAAAQVAGGGTTLRRALLNLVVNACEGDGARCAARVDVEVRVDDACARVIVDVIDDGPGFSAETLATGLIETCSTKVGGSGFGLRLTQALTQASGGTLTRGNRSCGGAVVSLSLPLAHASSARARSDR